MSNDSKQNNIQTRAEEIEIKKFLDINGLARLIASIKNWSAQKTHRHSFADISGDVIVYGNTRQNLWVNPSGTSNGVTVTSNDDGSLTISGNPTSYSQVSVNLYSVKPSSAYTILVDAICGGYGFAVVCMNSSGIIDTSVFYCGKNTTSKTFTTPEDMTYVRLQYSADTSNVPTPGTYRVMLREATEDEIAADQQTASTLQEGGTADLPQDYPVTLPADPSVYATSSDFDWCPPGINGVEPTGINVCSTRHECDLYESSSQYAAIAKLKDAKASDLFKAGDRVTAFVKITDGAAYFNESIFTDAAYVYSSYKEQKVVLTVKEGFNPDTSVVLKNTYAKHTKVDYCVLCKDLSETPVDMQGHALYSLPDGTRDELRIDSNGKMTIAGNIEKIVLNGSESWYMGTSPYTYYTVSLSSDKYSTVNLPDIYVSGLPSGNIAGGLYISNYGKSLYIMEPSFCTDVDGLKSWLSSNPVTVIYPLATPVKTDLGVIKLPEPVKSSSPHTFVVTNIPTEQTMDPCGIPIAYGGTGANTAEGARESLDVYSKSEIDERIPPSVLSVNRGGTGATSAKAAQYNLLNDAPKVSSEEGIIDTSEIAFFTSGASESNGAIQRLSMSTLWGYVLSKIRSIFGFNSSNVLAITNGGTGQTTRLGAINGLGGYSLDAGIEIQSNADLNNIKTVGNYICGKDTVATTVQNCPTGGRAFMLKVGDLLGDTKYPFQEVTRYTDGASWRRTYNMTSSTWNAWESTSLARFGTTLWSGTWSAGSITVNGINDYDMYIMKTTGQNDNLMLGVRDGNVIHCYSVYSTATNLMTLNTITIGITDNTLVRTMPRTWTLEGTAIKTANGALVINTIKGVL